MTFKPDSIYKKLAGKYNACAYIYKDGISLWEKRQVKSGKYETQIDVNHFWPCEIKMYSSDYNKEYTSEGMKCKRIVVHNPTLLLSGLERVDIYYGNNSQHSKEHDLNITGIHLFTQNGMEIKIDNTHVTSCDLVAQPDYDNFGEYSGTDSINEMIEYHQKHYENTEIHELI